MLAIPSRLTTKLIMYFCTFLYCIFFILKPIKSLKRKKGFLFVLYCIALFMDYGLYCIIYGFWIGLVLHYFWILDWIPYIWILDWIALLMNSGLDCIALFLDSGLDGLALLLDSGLDRITYGLWIG